MHFIDGSLLMSHEAESRAESFGGSAANPESPHVHGNGPGALALVGGSVIDGSGTQPIHSGVVVIENGRITAVGPASQVRIPDAALVLRCDGQTVLPGIIDSHTHIEQDLPATLGAFLKDGVTSLGNTGCGPDLVSQLHTAGGDLHAARVFAAGPALTAAGGYPSMRGDGSVARAADSATEAEAAVDELAALGADFIKLTQESFDFNYRTPGRLPVLGPGPIAAVVRRADTHGLLVRSHVHHVTQLDIALDAGVTSVEHMLFPLPPDMGYVELHREGALSTDALPGLRRRIARMVEQGVYLVPTLGGELINIRLHLPDFPADGLRAVEELLVSVLALYVEAGGKVALGSDWVGLPGIPAGMPRQEMEYMLAAGLTPLQVIEASTRHAATLCGQGQTLGVLAPGRHADLTVVGGDPLRDPAALDDIRAVVKDGHLAVLADSQSPPAPHRLADTADPR